MRHQDPRYDLHDLLRRGWFETYQSFQGRPIFDDCNYVVSFIGAEATKARLIGVCRVLGRKAAKTVERPAGCPYTEWLTEAKFFYDLRRAPAFGDLE